MPCFSLQFGIYFVRKPSVIHLDIVLHFPHGLMSCFLLCEAHLWVSMHWVLGWSRLSVFHGPCSRWVLLCTSVLFGSLEWLLMCWRWQKWVKRVLALTKQILLYRIRDAEMLLFIWCKPTHCNFIMIHRRENRREPCYSSKTHTLLIHDAGWVNLSRSVLYYQQWNVQEQYVIVHLPQLLENHVSFACYHTSVRWYFISYSNTVLISAVWACLTEPHFISGLSFRCGMASGSTVLIGLCEYLRSHTPISLAYRLEMVGTASLKLRR